MSYYQKAKELFKMIEQGKILDALDKCYHKDVVIIADDGSERIGIEQARFYDENLLREIQEVMGEEIITIASDEDNGITMVEFWIKLQFKNGEKRTIREVAVQYWENDLIIKETFYSKKCN